MNEKTNVPLSEHIALVSAISCLMSELSKAGHLDFDQLQNNIQGTAIAHRKKGNVAIADALHRLSNHFAATVRDPE